MLELTRSQLRRLSLEAVGAFSVVMVHGRKKVSRPDQVSGMKDYTLLRPLARIGLVYSYKVERRLMCVPEWQWREYLEKVITQEMFEGKRATH